MSHNTNFLTRTVGHMHLVAGGFILNDNLGREEQHLVASLSSSALADRQVTISEGDSTEQITRTLDRASPDLIGRIRRMTTIRKLKGHIGIKLFISIVSIVYDRSIFLSKVKLRA